MRMGLQRRRLLGISRLRIFAVIIVFFALLWGLGWMFVRLQPAYFDRLSAYAKVQSLKAVNSAVNQCFQEQDVSYESLILFSHDQQGQISAVEANSAAINRLQATISDTVQRTLENDSNGKLLIPAGSALGNPMFSALGYKIPVHVSPAAYTQVQLRDEFVDAGINQVKHTVFLDVTTNITVTSATSQKTETIQTSLLIGDTVIVGDVPNYYGGGIVYTGE